MLPNKHPFKVTTNHRFTFRKKEMSYELFKLAKYDRFFTLWILIFRWLKSNIIEVSIFRLSYLQTEWFLNPKF